MKVIRLKVKHLLIPWFVVSLVNIVFATVFYFAYGFMLPVLIPYTFVGAGAVWCSFYLGKAEALREVARDAEGFTKSLIDAAIVEMDFHPECKECDLAFKEMMEE